MELHLPEFPSLHGSGLGLHPQEMCRRHEGGSDVFQGRCSYSPLTLTNLMAHFGFGQPQAHNSVHFPLELLLNSLNPGPSSWAALECSVPAGHPHRWGWRFGDIERLLWVPVCLCDSSLSFLAPASHSSSPLDCWSQWPQAQHRHRAADSHTLLNQLPQLHEVLSLQ